MADRYGKIFEYAACGVLIVDLEGRIVDFNPTAVRLMGRARGNLHQTLLSEVLGLLSPESFPEQLKLLYQLGHTSLSAVAFGKSGERIEYLLDLSLVPWDDHEVALVIMRELTDRETVETERARMLAILAAENRLTRIFRLLSISEQKIDPYPQDSIQDEHARHVCEWTIRQLKHGIFKAALARAWRGEAQRLEPQWYEPDNESEQIQPYCLELQFHPLVNSAGQLEQIAIFVLDHTHERIASEEDRRADQHAILCLFAGSLLREINNYLGVILAQASALRLSSPAGGQLAPPAVGAILDAAQQAASLLGRAAEIAQTPDTNWSEVDLQRVASDAAMLLRHLLGKRIRVVYEGYDDLAAVRGDAGLLCSMIVALGRVAEQHMPVGGELIIRTYPLIPAGPTVAPSVGLSVTDTGLGMDPMARVRAMQPVFPGKQVGLGDSLDLAFARAVIRQHRGDVDLESAQGRGTQWRVVLPGVERKPRLTGPLPLGNRRPGTQIFGLRKGQEGESSSAQVMVNRSARVEKFEDTDLNAIAEEIDITAEIISKVDPSSDSVNNSRLSSGPQAIGLRPSSPPLHAGSGGGHEGTYAAVKAPCVLFADDEENFRDFSAQVLRNAGYLVDTVADGQQAVDRFVLAPDRYALAILDVYMPRLGGLETFLRMQVMQPDLPVIFVSGFARESSIKVLKDASPGRVEVIQKPYSDAVLIEAVRQALQKASRPTTDGY